MASLLRCLFRRITSRIQSTRMATPSWPSSAHFYGSSKPTGCNICLRYFNAAGADTQGEFGEDHAPETHLIPLVLDAAAGRRPDIKIFGTDYPTPDGTCLRDYIHVGDLARAHVMGLQALMDSHVESQAINLGTGRGYSVREVIETARRVTRKDIKVVETERRPGDPPRLVAAADRARTVL